MNSVSEALNTGPAWEAMTLPGLIFDHGGRILGINDAAQAWLGLSRRSALGQSLDAMAQAGRLRFDPPLGVMLAPITAGHGGARHDDLSVSIDDPFGKPRRLRATVILSPLDEAQVMASFVPQDGPDRIGAAQGVRAAARQAIGMAEMLAHEIKNPLAGIRGAAQLLAMSASDEDRELTDMIVEESRRIVSLLDQVEQFGDTSPPALAPVNLHDVLERARRSVAAASGAGLRFVTDYDPSLPEAMADADQLMQVFLNLMRNAVQAMDGQVGAEIRLRTSYDGGFRIKDGAAIRALPLQVEIGDNGPGIPAELQGQIFEPFISGRENGTGLGLALVSKIVTDHGGWVRLDSRPGRTVFGLSFSKAEG